MSNEQAENEHSYDAAGDDLERRVELLEVENARLRRQLRGLVGVANPNFDPHAFQRAVGHYARIVMIPLILLSLAPPAVTLGKVRLPNVSIGPLPLFGLPGQGPIRGVSIGVIAMGGMSLGVVAAGGLSVGVIALGGGAVGLVAIGGGALGVVAFGGGALGVYAIGGGAAGRYVLAGNGAGTYVFSLKRQDREAVEFWARLLPRLRDAVTSPLPVVPVETDASDWNAPSGPQS